MPDTRVHVDFNDLEDGQLTALTRHADDPSAVVAGAYVALWDEEGNSAQGRVIEVRERGLARIEMLRGTWRNRLTPPHGSPVPEVEDFIGHVAASYGLVFKSRCGYYTLSPPTPAGGAARPPAWFLDLRQQPLLAVPPPPSPVPSSM